MNLPSINKEKSFSFTCTTFRTHKNADGWDWSAVCHIPTVILRPCRDWMLSNVADGDKKTRTNQQCPCPCSFCLRMTKGSCCWRECLFFCLCYRSPQPFPSSSHSTSIISPLPCVVFRMKLKKCIFFVCLCACHIRAPTCTELLEPVIKWVRGICLLIPRIL